MTTGRITNHPHAVAKTPIRRLFNRFLPGDPPAGSERSEAGRSGSGPSSSGELFAAERPDDLYLKLRHLKKMRRAGLISMDEYEERKAELLKRY